MKYILVDAANCFFKSRHYASKYADDSDRVGMALHITLTGIQSVVKRFGGEDYHVVFCTEGRSWRKDFYKPYKANRAVKRAALTESEAELDQIFWETYDELITFMRERTNVSVLRCEIAEADDLIARFIHLHPNDQHVIISSDSDFAQLITHNVTQYNSIGDQYITLEGYFDSQNKPIEDKKIGGPKKLPDPQWLLFEKCVRGDSSDNVFSAYPGVRTKSTKKSVGLMEAWEDRHSRGFNWNNMMLHRWIDPDGVEHRVLDDYQRNVTLCDLSAQPVEIKNAIDNSIRSGLKRESIPNVGFNFLKFATKHELVKISDQVQLYSRWLNSHYTGVLENVGEKI